jgi:hypothetical protein
MWLRRRYAIEPIFSHAKNYHRMNKNHLLGKEGDRVNAILSAVGCNFRKLILAFYFSLKLIGEKSLFMVRNLLDFYLKFGFFRDD